MNTQTLKDLIESKRPEQTINAEIEAYSAARHTTRLLATQILPSEEALFRKLSIEVEKKTQWAEFEKRFMGRLDLEALLRQTRGDGSVPRWFLYNPLTPCDTVRWSSQGKIVFELMRDKRVVDRINTTLPNHLSQRMTYSTSPILLPHRIREQILKLKRENLQTCILFEPLEVSGERLPTPPDPALLVSSHGQFYVADYWDDASVEDPRALGTLHEFFVKTSGPDWLEGLRQR